MNHIARRLGIALVLSLLAGCYHATTASGPAETKSQAAPASNPVTFLTAPPGAKPLPADVSAVAPPQATVPAHAAPIVVVTTPVNRKVNAGDVVRTSCFTVTVAVAGIVQGNGCRLLLATQALGPGTEPDVPYLQVEAFTGAVSGLDDAVGQFLAGIASSKDAAARRTRGPYADDFGPFLGDQQTRMFGLDARLLAWGGAAGTHEVDVFTLLPADAYVWKGMPVSSLLVRGYSGGYHSLAFAASLASVRMN